MHLPFNIKVGIARSLGCSPKDHETLRHLMELSASWREAVMLACWAYINIGIYQGDKQPLQISDIASILSPLRSYDLFTTHGWRYTRGMSLETLRANRILNFLSTRRFPLLTQLQIPQYPQIYESPAFHNFLALNCDRLKELVLVRSYPLREQDFARYDRIYRAISAHNYRNLRLLIFNGYIRFRRVSDILRNFPLLKSLYLGVVIADSLDDIFIHDGNDYWDADGRDRTVRRHPLQTLGIIMLKIRNWPKLLPAATAISASTVNKLAAHLAALGFRYNVAALPNMSRLVHVEASDTKLDLPPANNVMYRTLLTACRNPQITYVRFDNLAPAHARLMVANFANLQSISIYYTMTGCNPKSVGQVIVALIKGAQHLSRLSIVTNFYTSHDVLPDSTFFVRRRVRISSDIPLPSSKEEGCYEGATLIPDDVAVESHDNMANIITIATPTPPPSNVPLPPPASTAIAATAAATITTTAVSTIINADHIDNDYNNDSSIAEEGSPLPTSQKPIKEVVEGGHNITLHLLPRSVACQHLTKLDIWTISLSHPKDLIAIARFKRLERLAVTFRDLAGVDALFPPPPPPKPLGPPIVAIMNPVKKCPMFPKLFELAIHITNQVPYDEIAGDLRKLLTVFPALRICTLANYACSDEKKNKARALADLGGAFPGVVFKLVRPKEVYSDLCGHFM